MKCIHCGSDTKGKDRAANGGKCGACHHAFAFEPTTDPLKITDGLFQKIVSDVSAQDTLFFTDRQLWYEFNRRVIRNFPTIPKGYGWAAGACGVGGIIAAIAISPPLIVVGIAGAITCGALGMRAGRKKPGKRVIRVEGDVFRGKYLDRYIAVHGPLEKMLPPPNAAPASPGSRNAPPPPPDLTSYSFDRALIVDHAETAAMLVANRFHFENNCAILSLDRRFPAADRFGTILDMLRRNPRLAVYALHDATVTGVVLAGNLHTGDWFPEPGVHIIDLGLRPKHVMTSAFVLSPGAALTPSSDVAAALAPEEAAWLAEGNRAELAALRPAKLMRAIYQGFARTTRVNDDGTIAFIDSGPDVWVYDSGAEVYAADSFG